MPLTAKGNEIMGAMRKEYGAEKGEQVFYASKNAGKISGVDAGDKTSESRYYKVEIVNNAGRVIRVLHTHSSDKKKAEQEAERSIAHSGGRIAAMELVRGDDADTKGWKREEQNQRRSEEREERRGTRRDAMGWDQAVDAALAMLDRLDARLDAAERRVANEEVLERQGSRDDDDHVHDLPGGGMTGGAVEIDDAGTTVGDLKNKLLDLEKEEQQARHAGKPTEELKKQIRQTESLLRILGHGALRPRDDADDPEKDPHRAVHAMRYGPYAGNQKENERQAARERAEWEREQRRRLRNS